MAGTFPAPMLRTRLFLNLVPFVVILLAIGIYAIALFSRITTNVDVTVTGNYRSVTAAQQMKLALSRMQGGVLLALEDNKGLGNALFARNKKIFEDNLNLQIQSAKLANEEDLNRRLSNNYEAFRKAGIRVLSANVVESQRRIFQDEVMPESLTIDGILDEIHQLNHSAILATTQNVEKITHEVTRLMLVGIIIALIISSYVCYHLARSILQPILSLTRATHELGEGNLDQIVRVTSRDELGDLADSFNKMAVQLRAYQQSTADRIVRLHSTMETTLASFPDPIFVLDSLGGITLMNPAAEELSRILELKNELPERLKDHARKALADGESFLPHSFKEVVSFRLGGHEQYFLPRILAMRDKNNALFGVAVVLYDVTRFRLLDDAKTNLVATVSHEIRTPLTSVRMVLHLLLEKKFGNLTRRQNELIVTARDEAERLLRILNDLLDLTKLEQGNPDLNTERIAPGDLVQSIVDAMRDTIAARDLKLRSQVDDGLSLISVDRQRLNHVFNNLINNAAKYSPAGGEILLCARRSNGNDVEFSVSDRGLGVPEDFHDRIFDRFFRVPNQTKTGAGLGLSIAREIVVAHGGRIGVRSRPDGGSEFYFVLNGVLDEELAVTSRID
jgi:NtrC-family two-component system sensor histidine kinase KinB